MKNKLLMGLVIGLLMFMSWAGVSFAERDSFTIPVSCSIPIVPGLNAPPFAKENTADLKTGEAIQKQQETKAESRDNPTYIEETKEEKIQLADGDTSTKTIQTIYER